MFKVTNCQLPHNTQKNVCDREEIKKQCIRATKIVFISVWSKFMEGIK